MTEISEKKETFLRDFFKRQRQIHKKSLKNVTILAEANIKTILMAGLKSDPTIERMEEILKELKKEQEESK